jgi:hypothetical protein
MALAGWYRDPTEQADGRYWDGQRWTDSATRGGYTLTVPMDPARAQIPPAPGSELVATPPPAQSPTPNVTVSTGRDSGAPVAAILGGVAVVIAIIAIVIALSNSGDSDDSPEPTEPPATTAAPAPAEGDG